MMTRELVGFIRIGNAAGDEWVIVGWTGEWTKYLEKQRDSKEVECAVVCVGDKPVDPSAFLDLGIYKYR
jgi:hypothetical protein